MTTTDNHNKTLLIVGRGPSAFTFDDWDGRDIMAVSSGIFALPEGVMPSHFVSMDFPKYFLGPVNRHRIAWGNDPKSRDWPFWADERIQKHVTSTILKRGFYRNFPLSKVVEAVPPRAHKAFFEAFDDVQHYFGYQPGWADYPNVRGWELMLNVPPSFLGPRSYLGLDNMRNSVFFAVQAAGRLGYRRMEFVGIFDGEDYQQHREVFARWHEQAKQQGLEWINLGQGSMLSRILPSQSMEIAA